MRKLLPCPFCGSDAELDTMQGFRRWSDGEVAKAIAVYCTKCSAQIHFCYDDIPDLTPEFVVNLWNTRRIQNEEVESAKQSIQREIDQSDCSACRVFLSGVIAKL